MNVTFEMESIDFPEQEALIDVKKTGKSATAAENMSSVLEDVNEKNQFTDHIISACYSLFSGYANSREYGQMALDSYKYQYYPEVVDDDYLEGATAAICVILAARLVAAIITVLDNSIAEQERHRRENKGRQQLLEQINEKRRLLRLAAYHLLNDQDLISILDDKLEKKLEKIANQLYDINKLLAAALPNDHEAVEKSDHTHRSSKSSKNTDASESFDWTFLNKLNASIALDRFNSSFHNLTPLDKHTLYTSLRNATQGDTVVNNLYSQFISEQDDERRSQIQIQLIKAIKNALNKEPIPETISFRANLVKTVGNFIISYGKGISLVTGVTALIALIPGAQIIALAAYIAAITLGLTFASLKVAFDMKEYRHGKTRHAIKNEEIRYRQTKALESLLEYSNRLPKHAYSQNSHNLFDIAEDFVEEEATEYIDSIETAQMPRGESAGNNVLVIGSTTVVAILTGWSAANAVAKILIGLGAEVGTGLFGLAGGSALAIPILGAAVATAFYVFKTALYLFRDHQAEQEKVNEVNCHLSMQKAQAECDETQTLKKISALKTYELLEKYIEDYLKTEGLKNIDYKNQSEHITEENLTARNEFFSRIEKVVGIRKDQTINENTYYSYLGSLIVAGDQQKHASTQLLISQLKSHMSGQNHCMAALDDSIDIKFASSNRPSGLNGLFCQFKAMLQGKKYIDSQLSPNQIIEFDLQKKPMVIRRNSDGKLDHAGNWRRFSHLFKETTNVLLGTVTPIMIGIALGATISSGPFFPLVGSIMVALALGAYVTSLILTHRRKTRMKDHNSTLMKIEMRDKTTRYDHFNQRQKIIRAKNENSPNENDLVNEPNPQENNIELRSQQRKDIKFNSIFFPERNNNKMDSLVSLDDDIYSTIYGQKP